MRAGPWVFAAGLALLCAGVVSTRADAWDARLPALTIPLALNGIDVIDMRNSAIDKVVISSGDAARVHYPGGPIYRRDEETPAASPACRTTGSTLRCTSGKRYLPGEPTLHLPPGRYRLLLRDASVLARSDIEFLALEASGQVYWKGPADALDVVLVRPRPAKGVGRCEQSQFMFLGGRVHDLRIRARAGNLNFGDLSEVGSIEVQAAGHVGLTVDKANDIARLRVLPLSSAQAGDQREACADPARAAASAAIR